ncbi:MAG: hypothetical protein QF570_12275 [Myxococcota bacterium]|nr:hypothetical protein [Myxococcota bacterium]
MSRHRLDSRIALLGLVAATLACASAGPQPPPADLVVLGRDPKQAALADVSEVEIVETIGRGVTVRPASEK